MSSYADKNFVNMHSASKIVLKYVLLKYFNYLKLSNRVLKVFFFFCKIEFNVFRCVLFIFRRFYDDVTCPLIFNVPPFLLAAIKLHQKNYSKVLEENFLNGNRFI